MDNNQPLRARADALDESRWARLRRPAAYQPRTGKTRARRDNHKQRIVK
jgi:hypothetical protein